MEKLNRIKVVLVEKQKTGKWLAEALGKDQSTDLSRPQPERAGKPGYQERLSLTDGLRLDVETERRRNLRPRGGNR